VSQFTYELDNIIQYPVGTTVTVNGVTTPVTLTGGGPIPASTFAGQSGLTVIRAEQ
jgi:hypothetical protein